MLTLITGEFAQSFVLKSIAWMQFAIGFTLGILEAGLKTAVAVAALIANAACVIVKAVNGGCTKGAVEGFAAANRDVGG